MYQCEADQDINTDGVTSHFNKDFGEFENLVVQCTQCETYECFNMNMPFDDVDDGVQTRELPIGEEVNRHYVRVLQRMIREDFKDV